MSSIGATLAVLASNLAATHSNSSSHINREGTQTNRKKHCVKYELMTDDDCKAYWWLKKRQIEELATEYNLKPRDLWLYFTIQKKDLSLRCIEKTDNEVKQLQDKRKCDDCVRKNVESSDEDGSDTDSDSDSDSEENSDVGDGAQESSDVSDSESTGIIQQNVSAGSKRRQTTTYSGRRKRQKLSHASK